MTGPPQPTSSARFASPESYTPKHLAEKILTSRSALEGERKLVTVLFADLKGSMELLADRDPEEARNLLDPVLERMMEAVHRYEGTVNQVMGDGIMALFGAPLAHEDHAVRACYAALRMQESVKRYAEEVHRSAGVPLHIRVGVNSGEVVVRSIGSDLHMDYTAVGQTTHLAARLEQMAMPGSILISPDTLNLAEGYVVVKSLGERPVKGLEAPVDVFEVIGASSVRSRLHVAAARGLTRFVGRDAELNQLRQALERAGSGHGQVVAVVGEPGVGKSRLFWEFTQSHRTQRWLLLESSSVSYGKATAFLPLIDLLRAYFQIEAGDEPRKIREKVTGKLLSLDEALRSTLPAFLALFELPIDDAAWQALDPPQRRQRTLDAIKRLLLRESQIQPLLVVFEDLHWIDGETQALLDGLVESLPTSSILLLVNYRPEYQHRWGSKSYYRQLQIDPLQPESAGHLLHALLGDHATLGPLIPLLMARTEGNPLFLEESVRTLVEARVLEGERGAYRLVKDAREIQVPPTVQAVLAARIDRLPPGDKRLLQSAAVIGKDVPGALLQAIADLPEPDLRRAIAQLQAAEFLYETRLFPDVEYTFKHALTHDVAYGGLLQERRRTLHARIVAAIEAANPDRLVEHVEQLAHHALRSELWDKAVTYLRQAGAKAYARSANREAAACFEHALEALARLPQSRETIERAIDLRFDLRHAIFVVGQIGPGIELLREAEGMARALDDRERLGWTSAYMANSVWMTGRSREAMTCAQTAKSIGEALGDLPLTIAGNYYLSGASLIAGDYRRAEECRGAVVRLLGSRRDRLGMTGFPAAISHSYIALALAERGEFDAGIAQGREAVRVGEEIGHPFTMAWTCWALAYLYDARGDLDQAVRLLERARAIAQEWGLAVWSGFLPWSLGHVYAASGRVAEAVPLIEESEKAQESLGIEVWRPLLVTHLGEACLRADRMEDARAHAERAWTLARERGERGHEAHALRLLGEIASLADPLEAETAARRYQEAMTLAEELGMQPLVAHCHLGLGRLHRRTGDRATADEHFATSTAMYREMGMSSWLEKAEAALRPLQ